jgi:hypothetical protein
MTYRTLGLSPDTFLDLYGLSDAALLERGVCRQRVDRSPGFPDRIELRDADPGETVLLLNYTHQPAPTAYRASHAIFVREGAHERYDAVDVVPAVLCSRPLSIRAFDHQHLMIDADLASGQIESERLVCRLLADPRVAYLQAHFAKRGCYAARFERV